MYLSHANKVLVVHMKLAFSSNLMAIPMLLGLIGQGFLIQPKYVTRVSSQQHVNEVTGHKHFCTTCRMIFPMQGAAAERPRAESPSAESSRAVSPRAESPSAECPRVESPRAESPSAECPRVESPSAESPSAESPSAESPSAERPSTESPSAESPSAERPSTESPSAECPRVESS